MNNATANRAVAMSIHLANTFMLVAAIATCVYRAWEGDEELSLRRSPGRTALYLGALLALVVLGMTGAVAALGDTLAQQSVFSPFVDLLMQLRIIHPFTALAVTALVVFCGLQSLGTTRKSALGLLVLIVVQLGVGLTNVILKVPVSVQLLHLLLADSVWILLVFCALGTLSVPRPTTASTS